MLVVACGGRAWNGIVEADALRELLQQGGVPGDAIVCEHRSRDTFENAMFAARILGERGISRVVVVTCTWHVPRARSAFARAGLVVVEAFGAAPPDPGVAQRAFWHARERLASLKDRFR